MKKIKKRRLVYVSILASILILSACSRDAVKTDPTASSDSSAVESTVDSEKETGFEPVISKTVIDLEKLYEDAYTRNLDNLRYEQESLKMTSLSVYQNDPMIIFESEQPIDMQTAEEEYRWFSLEMGTNQGTCIWLIANILGTREARGITILVNPDSNINRYAVDLAPLFSEIRSKYSSHAIITGWGLIVSDIGNSDVVIKSLGFGSIPLGEPELSVSVESYDSNPVYVNTSTKLTAEFINIGQENHEASRVKIQGKSFDIPEVKPGEKFLVEFDKTFTEPGINSIDIEFENRENENVQITAYANPGDGVYVPKPVVAESEYNIGAFYYGGWFDKPTWKPILPFPDRKPYLGWYEAGDPVAMDWQIKWAVENGISFFTFCWYRTAGTQEDPVGADISYNDAINKALPNARYRDMIKYAIMWCNNNTHAVKWGVRDADEFLNVLVPYWMENYFKDPSYLIIDNKPVFYLWQVKEFIKDVGGVQEARDALTAMNEYAKDHGFDGIYFLGNYYYQTPANALSKEIGIDRAYYYIAPIDVTISDDIVGRQKFYLDIRDGQARAAGMTWVPAASVGLDFLGWNLSRPVHRWISTPEIFADVLQMNKDHIDRQNHSRKEDRILMLSVWDEYGEGHFIIPSEKYGFEYLDAVRNVFSSSPAPDHVTPEELGMKLDQVFSSEEEANSRIIHYWPLEELN